MTQISYTEATSNLSSWIPNSITPDWLRSPAIDNWVLLLSILVIFIVFVCSKKNYFLSLMKKESKGISDTWRHLKKITVWQAACLVAGEEPKRPIITGTAPYPYLKILRQAVEDNELPACKNEDLSWSELEGEALNDFLNKKDIKSKFSFPVHNLTKKYFEEILKTISQCYRILKNELVNLSHDKDLVQKMSLMKNLSIFLIFPKYLMTRSYFSLFKMQRIDLKLF